MAIDSSIAMGVKPPQIESPMNALAKVLQIRDAQQGQQLNAMKMDEYQRGIASQNSLRQLLGGMGTDHQANQQKLLQGGYMKEAQDYGKNQAEILKDQTAAEKDKIAVAMQKLALGSQLLGSVRDQASYDQALATAQANGLDVSRMQPNYDPAFVAAKRQEGKTMKEQIEEYWKQKGYDTPDANAVLSAQTSRANNAASNSTTMRGQNMTDSRGRELNQITREVGLQKKELEVGKMQDEATARKQQKQAAVSSVKNQIGVIDKALGHKGRETATGLSSTLDPRNYIPGTNATDFKVVVDQIGGAAFLQAFESLKGGGQITEVEGKKATDAMARLNRAQSDGEFKTALTDLRKVMSDGLSRLSNETANPPPASSGAKFLGFE
jgi:hypothetical protein